MHGQNRKQSAGFSLHWVLPALDFTCVLSLDFLGKKHPLKHSKIGFYFFHASLNVQHLNDFILTFA